LSIVTSPKIVQAEWFAKQKQKRGRPNGANRPVRGDFKKNEFGLPIFDEDSLPLRTVDVISIAGPIIQEFSKETITIHEPKGGALTPSFKVLYRIVCIYSNGFPNAAGVNRELNRVRHNFPKI
jgi:hypothetical protein